MDDLLKIVSTLANLGGFAVMAGVILWLHHTSLKNFREELSAERKDTKDSLDKERELRHLAANRANDNALALAVAMQQNTSETKNLAQEVRAIAQENRAASAALNNLVVKLGMTEKQ